MTTASDWRLAVDIGGTFTDVVLLDATSGRVVVDKTLTTPHAPLEAVRTGISSVLARAGLTPAAIVAPIVHATTLITNALIEGKLGRAAVVTTTGFGDTLEIRDEHRYDMYDLQIEFPPPPIPRHLVFEIDERTMADGRLDTRPSPQALATLAEELRAAALEAVGLCFLNSYANPANEREVAAYLRAELGIPVCISSEISPQIREYPRMITTACNAATMPVIGPYLEELTKWLAGEGFSGGLLMMLSNGGVVSAEDAARSPIRLVESGPAAGALAGTWFARRLGEPQLLCFDMGGTTAKACLISNYEPELTNTFEVARIYRFKKGSGFPVSVPSVDLVEIGAGGGSIAHVDRLGLLKVGPESAGAAPGPASYGRGGTRPAVTDADLALGFLDAGFFLGGDMPLDLAAADTALGTVAEGLGLAAGDTAAGINEVVNQNMAAAARMHAIEMGVDLRGVTLIAFGGAGPVHACGVAELLEAPRVVFPVNASVLSAFGTLVSPVRIDLARSMVRRLDLLDAAEREAVYDELRAEGRRVLTGAGVPDAEVRFRYGVDARYAGQGNELTIWLGEGAGWPVDDAELEARFTEEYTKVYGMSIPDVAVEVVTWRLSALTEAPRIEPAVVFGASGAATPHHHRSVRLSRRVAPTDVPVYRREELGAGARFDGPAIVEERETTAVILSGWSVEVASDGSLIATKAAATGLADPNMADPNMGGAS